MPAAHGVVDVVVDVGDPVHQPHDPPLERGRAAPARCGAGCPSRTCSVRFRSSSRSTTRSECSLWRNARPPALAHARVEHLLADVPERRVAEVVAEPDRLGQVLVQPERPGHVAGDPAGLERVREPGAVVVALRRDEHLGLVLEPPERLRVDDPVAVALERRAVRRVGLLARRAGPGRRAWRAASGAPPRGARSRSRKRGRRALAAVRLITLVIALRPAYRPPDRGLRGRHPGDRHAVRRAAHVVEPGELEEADRVGVAAVLAADAELEVRLGLAAGPGRQPHEPADAGPVDRLERAAVHDLLLDVLGQEAALHVVAREAERGLREVVRAEREEVGLLGDPVGHEAGPRQLDHRPDGHVEVARRPPPRRPAAPARASARAPSRRPPAGS